MTSEARFYCLPLACELSVGSCGARHKAARRGGGGKRGYEKRKSSVDIHCKDCPTGKINASAAVKPRQAPRVSRRERAIADIDAHRHDNARRASSASLAKARAASVKARRLSVTPGEQWGAFTIVREVEPRRKSNGREDRMVLARCRCGTESVRCLYDVRGERNPHCRRCSNEKKSRERVRRRGVA